MCEHEAKKKGSNPWKDMGVKAAQEINLRKVMEDLQAGKLALPERGSVNEDRWNNSDMKGFRNAMSALVVGAIWPEYEKTIRGLTVFPGSENPENMSPAAIAKQLGKANELLMDRLVVELVSKGTMKISGNPGYDQQCWDLFGWTCEDGIAKGHFSKRPPYLDMDSRAAFLAWAIRVLNVLFDVPCLIDRMTRDSLTPEQHRRAVLVNIKGFIAQCYLPTFDVFEKFLLR